MRSWVLTFIVALLVLDLTVRREEEKKKSMAELTAMLETAMEIAATEKIQLSKEDRNKKFTEKIKSSKSDWEKSVASASNFYEYYWINGEGIKEYCEKNNVSISYYVKKFSDANLSYFYVATKILEKDFQKNNVNFSYETWKEWNGGTMNPIVAQGMFEIKKRNNLNDVQICELFNEEAKEIVNFTAYEKENEVASDLLLNTKL